MSATDEGRSCYRYKGVLIPGCLGSTLNNGNDFSRCTCPRGTAPRDLAAEVRSLKKRVAKLEAALTKEAIR